MSRYTVRHNISGVGVRADVVPEVDLSGGWSPSVWLGAPAPGGLALPAAQPSMAWMYSPRGVFVDDTRVVVTDTGNHRVLIWHSIPDNDEQPADVVLGQPDGQTEGPAAGGRGPERGMHLPTGVLIHDGRLIVADAWHHRILVWDSVPESDDVAPDVILGQPDAASHGENRDGPAGPDSFRWPHDVTGRDDLLLIADAGDHRVLGWSPQPASDRGADLVIGQSDFTTAEEWPYGPHTNDRMRFPYAVQLDGETLAVADTANNRILLWDSVPDGPIGPGAFRGADWVLAQPDFGANGENRWTSVQRDTLCWPYGLSLHGDLLAVADSGNNRVMLWRRETRP